MILRLFIIVVSMAAAGGAAFLSMKAGKAPEQTAQRVQPAVAMVEVLVAAAPISAGEILSPDKMLWQPRPEPSITESQIRRTDQPDAISELSGSFVNATFAQGQPIRPDRLLETNVNLLSNKIAPGKRAVAVKVTAENTAGGFILPGDRVDVVHTTSTIDGPGMPARNESQIIISNARVLAIDQTAVQTPEGSAVGKTATLELSPDETERVVAAEASGLLSLALRAVTDHGEESAEIEVKEIRTVRIHRGTETSTVTLR